MVSSWFGKSYMLTISLLPSFSDGCVTGSRNRIADGELPHVHGAIAPCGDFRLLVKLTVG